VSFGGFGGIPRKAGEKHKSTLGVMRGRENTAPRARTRLGRFSGAPPKQHPPPAAPMRPLPFAMGSIAPFSVVILSKLDYNLKSCLAALFRCEPDLPHDRVIVVDDGAAAGCARYFPNVRYVNGVKPFVFARNANIGIAAAGGDVILLNDDALLMTPGGFSDLSRLMSGSPMVGICSAALFNGASGISQASAKGIRREQNLIPFVSIYIPKRTIERVGLLDERFTGYGYEDNDYCARVAQVGLGMAFYDGCTVDHGKKERSTFRVRGDFKDLIEENRKKFEAKWRTPPAVPPARPSTSPAVARPPTDLTEEKKAVKLKVSCILTSYNRPRYVRQAFKSLEDQTHQNFELLVFDDSSKMNIGPILEEFHLPISELVVSKVTPAERRTVNRLSVNINRGLAAASGDLVCFLADDDYYFPGWFEMAAKFFQDNPSVKVGYGKLMYSKSETMDFSTHGKMRWPGTIVDNPFGELDHNQVIHRRFGKPYTWSEDFREIRNPDAHYFKAIAAHHPFYPIDGYAAVKRIHHKNLQKNVSDLIRERAEDLRE
jgi:spore maturation protein CgeD